MSTSLPKLSPTVQLEPSELQKLETTAIADTIDNQRARALDVPDIAGEELDPPQTDEEILAYIKETANELAGAPAVDVDVIMNLIARKAQFLTDARGAVVELKEGNELVYRAATGTASKSRGIRIDSRKSMSGLCFHGARPIWSTDTEKDNRVDKAACRWVGIRSMVLAPICVSKQSVGVLAVISPAPNAFLERDVNTLQLLADVLSQSLIRAKAFS